MCVCVCVCLIEYIYFILGCSGSSLLCRPFSSCSKLELLSSCGTKASHCCGLSCCGARAPGQAGSVVAAWGVSSCSSQALEDSFSSSMGMCSLPRPGIEPTSPALAGGFFTTEPPGKPHCLLLNSPPSLLPGPGWPQAHRGPAGGDGSDSRATDSPAIGDHD